MKWNPRIWTELFAKINTVFYRRKFINGKLRRSNLEKCQSRSLKGITSPLDLSDIEVLKPKCAEQRTEAPMKLRVKILYIHCFRDF
jgi:hypothetical protein